MTYPNDPMRRPPEPYRLPGHPGGPVQQQPPSGWAAPPQSPTPPPPPRPPSGPSWLPPTAVLAVIAALVAIAVIIAAVIVFRGDDSGEPSSAADRQAAESSPVVPVPGAYPGAGGPRPADAEPLPTYVGRYSKLKSAHLLTPTRGIGCDFNVVNSEGSQGLCGIVSFNKPTSPLGCVQRNRDCKGKWVFPLAGDRVGAPTDASGTTGWQNQPASDGYTVPVVQYGKQYYFEDWVIASESNGLTVWNTKTGSGVFLSNEKAERFDGPGSAGEQPSVGEQPSANPDIVFGSEVSNSKGLGAAKPSTIYYGGHPSSIVENITWSSWGGDRAEGTGDGNRREYGKGTVPAPATVVAFDPGPCNGKQAYRKAVIYFPSKGDVFSDSIPTNICYTHR